MVTTEQLDAKLSDVYDRMNVQGNLLTRLDEKLTATQKETSQINASMQKLVRVDERLMAFQENDRDAKQRMWKHIESNEQTIGQITASDAKNALISRILITILLAVSCAGILFAAGLK